MIKQVPFIPIIVFLCFFSLAGAQHPVLKVDLNETTRKLKEINEPGYTSWQFRPGIADTFRNNGVQVIFRKIHSPTGTLASSWYKLSMQVPYFARLVSDGISVKDGDRQAVIEMRISGLPTGRHSLLTYHNLSQSGAQQDFSPIAIYSGNRQLAEVLPTVRALRNEDAAQSYIDLPARAGSDIILEFRATDSRSAAIRNIVINGFEINTPNPALQAGRPFPAYSDEHVELTGRRLQLSWHPASGVREHAIYFGRDSLEVASATPASPTYRGRQTDTVFQSPELYSGDHYYWRIDEITASGSTPGDVWYFRPAQTAFPGAEGYGRNGRGGRDGKVVHVTNLRDDNQPGSLRYAVEHLSGPRTIVFDVGGIITLKDRLTLTDDYVTVAGQTAPGKGICIKGAPFGSTGNDCIIRFMRVRLGAGRTFDGMGLTGANHSIMDHCSISWTIDEAFSSRGALNITLQRTLISEALNAAGHKNYEPGKQHGFAATISGYTGSYHHNLLAHCAGRNWSLGGALDGDAHYSGYIDITNNVVYNWKHRTTDGGSREVNFVNNYYKPGPASEKFYALTMQHEGVGLGTQRAYFAGNVMPGHFDELHQEKGRNTTWSRGEKTHYETYVDQPFFPSLVTTQTARQAYKDVLSDVGCTQPFFDLHDQRIIRETRDSSFTYRGSKTGLPGLPDHQQDVGGWEDYPEQHREANWDSDGDGLPDWWEALTHTNSRSGVGDFSDAHLDEDRDGYTRLDAYLHWMALPHYFSRGEQLKIDLAALTRGYTRAPQYRLVKAENGKVVISGTQAVFQPARPGLASFSFEVRDSDGDSMIRQVNIRVEKATAAL
ncbi:hypothetical protein GCM10027051_33610 [Niabella terrae]